jgi:hypothetical protein
MSSKGYTLNYFISIIRSANSKVLSENVARAVSPRVGASSVKFETLQTWLSGKAYDIAVGNHKFSKLGSTPRARLLKALKARKAGTFSTLVK